MEGTQAIVTEPRIALPVSRMSVSAPSSSVSRRCARGRKSAPVRVSSTERVVRSISRTPRYSSSVCSRRDSAVCVMCSSAAARRKLRRIATAMNACTPGVSIFIDAPHTSIALINALWVGHVPGANFRRNSATRIPRSMTSIESTPEMAAGIYRAMERSLETVRRRLRRPLTLAEKVLLGHLDDPQQQELVPGRSYLLLRPDRVVLQDLLGQTGILQFMQSRRERMAIPT